MLIRQNQREAVSREAIVPFQPWVGIVTGPVVFLVNLQISFSVISWVCATGQYWVIHVATIASVLLVMVSGWLAWRTWHTEEPVSFEDGAPPERLMGFAGVLIAWFFVVAVPAIWLPSVLNGACR